MPIQQISIQQKIKDFAQSLGFDLVGFTKAKIEPRYLKAYKNWIKNHCNGLMKYMEKSKPRSDLTKILPGAKSVIVLGMNYFNEQKPLKKDHARIARYAYGRDYHKIISKKLKKIEKFIQDLAKESNSKNISPKTSVTVTFPRKVETKSYVDTGPILERALAEQADLGTIGKNTCLITKEFGSWIFLAEIITNIDFGPVQNTPSREDEPTKKQNKLKVKSVTGDTFSKLSTRVEKFPLCGRCTRCIDACPTGAIIAPGVIDARKCISYQTIENKGKIPKNLAKKIKNSKYIFGCDICQEVCPHNFAKQKPTSHKDLTHPKIAGDQLPLKKILSIKSEKEFTERFAGSPLMRAKLKGLKRNAKIFSEPF